MPSKDQVERVTDRMYKDARQSGQSVSRDQVRQEVVKRAQRLDNKKSK
jgi:hypothetical protein